MTLAVDLLKPDVGWDVIALRLFVGLMLAGAIGFEREIAGQPAGLRTHITVGLGAALFGFISVHGFDAYVAPRNDNNYQIDVTRVASQVVVGVGFLAGLVGYAVLEPTNAEAIAIIQSIAAGALVVVVVNEMGPIAVRGAGRRAGLAAAAGFAVAAFLSTINS